MGKTFTGIWGTFPYLDEAATVRDSTIALVAARVGKTRLIDNHLLADPFPCDTA